MGVNLSATVLLVLLSIGATSVRGMHFRGGAISWRPIPDDPSKIRMRYDMGFKHDVGTGGHQSCSDGSLNGGYELDTPGWIKCEGCGGDPLLRKMAWICSDFSVEGDYDIGGLNFDLDVPVVSGNNRFVVYYQSKCWVQPIIPSRNGLPGDCEAWKMMTEVNLNPRPDGKGINSSPVTSPIPVQQFHKGCDYALEIPVTDPDGDRTRCRMTRPGEGECPNPPDYGTICGDLDRVTINDDCTMRFDTHGQDGNYAVRLMIEDLDEQGNVLSKVSLSFLLYVSPDDTTCDTPSIVSPPDVCKTIKVGQAFSVDVVAEAATAELPIVRIDSVKPRGMTSSDQVRQVPGQPLQKYITLNWTPTIDAVGRKTVKFSAIDSSGFQSAYENMYLNVVESIDPLRADPVASNPADGAQLVEGHRWTVKFNRDIKRPTEPAYIKIVNSKTNQVVDQIDASSAEKVEFKKRGIRFYPDVSADPVRNADYILQLDEGVAVEVANGCSLDSEPAEWTVRVLETLKPATQPPPMTATMPPPTPKPPVIYECKSDTVDITPPTGTSDGDDCFVHLERSRVTVDANNIRLPYQLCCPKECSSSLGPGCVGTLCPVKPQPDCQVSVGPPGQCCPDFTCSPGFR